MTPPSRPLVLLVDDNVANLDLLEATLTGLNIETARATDGVSAVEIVRERDVAVVLLDVRMPGIDGFETARRIRERELGAPIIFITAADADTARLAEAYEAGGVDYLVKPINPPVLRAKVRVFAELYTQRAKVVALTEQLRVSNADLEQFAYAVSHDLKEPLRTITNFAQMIEAEYGEQTTSEFDELLGYVTSAARRMREMIDSLLLYSRVGRAGTTEPVELERVVDTVLDNLQAAIEESGAEIVRDPLPTIEGDRPRLVQLFQNLIGNAIKFRGEQPPRIAIGATETRNGWRFSVADNGIGIDPRNHGRIFGIFSRLHTAREYPGTGVGLSLARRIVERHGGTMTVESAPREGTTFHFTLSGKGEQ